MLLLVPEVAAAAIFNRLRLSWRLSERVIFNGGLLGIVLVGLSVLLDDDARCKIFLLGIAVIILAVLAFIPFVRAGMVILVLLLLNGSSDMFS